jgi:uncharacterized metal-binding protein YceD (DUF177 family)
MKLRLDNISNPIRLDIQGSEEWLAPVYESFQTPPGSSKPLIKGWLEVVRETDEIFKVSGRIEFTPWVDCSRCGDAIPWNASGQFTYRAMPQEMDEVEDGSGERSFSFPDEDILTYQDLMLDIGELVNDQIQLAIPLQTVPRAENRSDCTVCGRSLESSEVFHDSEDDGAKNRPFDVLKNLKLSEGGS